MSIIFYWQTKHSDVLQFVLWQMILKIADALEKQSGIKLDKRKIAIAEPIKSVGTYTVTCKLGYEITAPLTVKIEEA